VCGSSARTDLYGGQLAIAVPTVTGITPNTQYGGYSVWSPFPQLNPLNSQAHSYSVETSCQFSEGNVPLRQMEYCMPLGANALRSGRL
jgi:hypothetical protein